MGAMRLCFLVFCLFLASVSSVRKLNNIDDLRNTGYGRPPPRHGLQLLLWFAQNVDVDQNNNLISVNFNPTQGDYGFHQFRNREGILPPLRSGQSYYEVGNLNRQGAREFPDHVQSMYRNSDQHDKKRNMDRLIVTLDENRPYRISRVFITAHNYARNDFNSSDTYEIDPKRLPNSQCNTYEGIKLEIKTTTQGYLKLIWENIPAKKNIIMVSTNEDCTQVKVLNNYESSGALDTSVALNAGLQPRLQLYTSYLRKADFWYGPEFDGANRVIPIRIKGFDASLQLYAKSGKACARLYIKKTFSNWKDVLYYSWVGFYKSSQDKTEGYYTSVCCEFCNFKSTYNSVLAQTTPWESEDKGNLQSEPSSTWSYPEFFYKPEFFDANNVIPIKIQKYDAGLQLFTKDEDLHRLEKNYYSWVGFYTSSQKADKNYYTYQYAVDFEHMEDGTKNFDVYQFKSELAIAPGVQICFLMDKSYNKKIAETEPWKSG
ncbi:hypothetical protein ABG768_013477 [Culter alburnus]|uniref:Uncharacterized protein n=1 Tax=Culter alburnus TaxID=194366 RepID=A0AAW2B5N2_CULAL